VQGVVTQWPAITRGQVKAKREQLKGLFSYLRSAARA
jgi:hypothetical protein